MPSKTVNKKRASLPRSSGFTKDFLADWERLSKTGRYDLSKLKQVMLLLIANDEPLGAEWQDHELKGDWKGHRERSSRIAYRRGFFTCLYIASYRKI